MRTGLCADCVLGVDLGGTKMALAAVDSGGGMAFSMEVPSPSGDGEAMVSTLVELVKSGRSKASTEGLETIAAGIGAAGFISYEEGLLLESPNISWEKVPLVSIVARELDLPTFLDNDANCATLGELHYGVAKGARDFVLLTLGTGIGGGICSGGVVYRGSRGTAGEIGHCIVDPNGPMCNCGRRGCLEAMGSGTALVREAERLSRDNASSLLNEMRGVTGRLAGESVSEAAEQGDETALAAFDFVSRYLGIGIANVIALFDPELVVLGGGVSHSGLLLLDDVRASVKENGIQSLVKDARIELSTLGNDAGLLGAAALAWEGTGPRP
jgi:glucokinase